MYGIVNLMKPFPPFIYTHVSLYWTAFAAVFSNSYSTHVTGAPNFNMVVFAKQSVVLNFFSFFCSMTEFAVLLSTTGGDGGRHGGGNC